MLEIRNDYGEIDRGKVNFRLHEILMSSTYSADKDREKELIDFVGEVIDDAYDWGYSDATES